MRHIATAFVAVLLALGVLCAFVGCKHSDYTTQVIYDESSETVDEQNTVQVNSLSADETSAEMPQLQNAGEDNEESVASLPVAGSDESSVAIPKVEYDENAAGDQLALNPKRSDQATDANTASGTQTNKKQKNETNATDDEDDSAGKGDSDADSDSKEAGKKVADGGTAKRSSSEKKVYDDYGEFPEIPRDVEHVAVVGRNSSTVAAIASKGAILAGSSDFLGDEQVKKVFGAKLGAAKKLWNNDGKLANAKKLAALDIQLVFIDEDDSKALTKKQKNYLLKQGIIIYVLPDMSSVKEIETSVSIVGEIFAAGGDTAAGKRADKLISYYKDTISMLKGKLGGAVAGGYDIEESQDVESSVESIYTLYISDWDTTAVYKDLNGYVTSEQGVGIAHLGSAWSPLAYLISLGGAVDNASTGSFSHVSSGRAFVWQFNQNKVPAAYANWKSFDRAKQDYRIIATDGFKETLLWSQAGKCGLGSDGFPRVLVASQEIAELMRKDAVRVNGLYHPYPSVTSGGEVKISVVGFYANGVLCDACIGTSGDAAESVLNDGTTTDIYEITVNPCGLFNSWTDGSVESILEAEWIYSLYQDEDYDIRSRVKLFYKNFYGYELSEHELDSVLSGPESMS